ncbi:MAG TPA: hypothetical protein VFT65_01405, partial [Candidatus Angelobacter sp.]|nr:hypothetical protein [Candidatus Angelobacter sp.]
FVFLLHTFWGRPIMKTMLKVAKIGLWCGCVGLVVMVLGVAASGGFGSRGTRHMFPFLPGVADVVACAAGILVLAGATLTDGFKKAGFFFDAEVL